MPLPVPPCTLCPPPGKLGDVKLAWRPEAALTVVMAAKGYPGDYPKGSVIRGFENVTTAKVWARVCVAGLGWGEGHGHWGAATLCVGIDGLWLGVHVIVCAQLRRRAAARGFRRVQPTRPTGANRHGLEWDA